MTFYGRPARSEPTWSGYERRKLTTWKSTTTTVGQREGEESTVTGRVPATSSRACTTRTSCTLVFLPFPTASFHSSHASHFAPPSIVSRRARAPNGIAFTRLVVALRIGDRSVSLSLWTATLGAEVVPLARQAYLCRYQEVEYDIVKEPGPEWSSSMPFLKAGRACSSNVLGVVEVISRSFAPKVRHPQL